MANPPITIGSFDNVPAPGSPIKSDWPQEISTYAQALPRGYMGHALVTAAQGPISTSNTLLTGLTVTWTAQADRRYRTSYNIPISKDGTTAIVWVDIQTGAAVQVEQVQKTVAANVAEHFAGFVVEWGLSGPQTRRLQISLNAGAVTMAATATKRAWLLVEDIGSTIGLPA